ncbi:MAG: oligosaccharide flippase family protein [Gammaproteobacteria bacterium]|nr:oligosaccharide flippase family protein [Gammaproteobacteria bacterium]
MKRIKVESPFIRNVLTLFTGTTFAQAIPITISPILTRLYSPEEFGVFALYLSIVSILTVISTGKYTAAIVLQECEDDALRLMYLIFALVFFVSIITFILILCFENQIAKLLGYNDMTSWLYFVAISVFISGVYEVSRNFSIRIKKFNNIAISRIYMSISTGITQLAYGAVSHGISGLLGGYVIGQVVGLSVIWRKSVRPFIDLHKNVLGVSSIFSRKTFVLAQKYSHFPTQAMPASLLNILAHQLPIIMLGYFFGPHNMGLYYFGYRVVSLPLSLIGGAITDVSYKYTVDIINNKQSIKKYIERMTGKLIGISVIPFTALIIWGKDFFSFVFGQEWEIAGYFVQILALPIFLRFISSPITIFSQVGRNDLLLKWQIVFFVLTIISLLVGGGVNSLEVAICILSLSYSLCYIGLIWLNFKLSGAKFRNVILSSLSVFSFTLGK